MAAKKEKAASKRAKVSTGKLPDDVKAIKAELNALAARQAALLKKLEKAIEGGAKKKAAPKKAAAEEDSEDEEASDEEEEEVADPRAHNCSRWLSKDVVERLDAYCAASFMR